MLPPKNRPRYLPTLTQVVTHAELEVVDQALPDVEVGVDFGVRNEDEEQRVQRIVEALIPQVNARMRETLQEMLDASLGQLESNLQSELETMVRRAISGRAATLDSGPL